MDKEALILSVWEKGQIVDGFSPDLYRKDPCGAWIVWDKYGANDNIYGWEIDHIFPLTRLDKLDIPEEKKWDLRNLRPMQHQNNASKGDDYPSYTSIITSEGNKNVEKERNLTVNPRTREIIDELFFH